MYNRRECSPEYRWPDFNLYVALNPFVFPEEKTDEAPDTLCNVRDSRYVQLFFRPGPPPDGRRRRSEGGVLLLLRNVCRTLRAGGRENRRWHHCRQANSSGHV